MKVTIKLQDPDGEIQVLLQALGYEIPKAELEMLLSAVAWKKRLNQGTPQPPMTIKNIKKFREDHIQFMANEFQKHAQKEVTRKKNEVLAQGGKTLEDGTLVDKHGNPVILGTK